MAKPLQIQRHSSKSHIFSKAKQAKRQEYGTKAEFADIWEFQQTEPQSIFKKNRWNEIGSIFFLDGNTERKLSTVNYDHFANREEKLLSLPFWQATFCTTSFYHIHNIHSLQNRTKRHEFVIQVRDIRLEMGRDRCKATRVM